MLLLSILYRLVRCLFELTAVLVRRDLSKDAELLILRHENAVSRRQISRVRDTPADWVLAGRPYPGSCHVAAGRESSRSLPPRSWPGTANWSRAHGTTPHAASPDVPPTAAAITNLVIRMATENPA
jgi:putative transposase